MTKQDVLVKLIAHFSQPDAVYGYGNVWDGDPDADADERENDECYSTACVYRGDGDPSSEVRCAMGVLIPDELYDRRMEQCVASAALTDFPALAVELGEVAENPEWIDRIQSIHDNHARERLAMPFLVRALAQELADLVTDLSV